MRWRSIRRRLRRRRRPLLAAAAGAMALVAAGAVWVSWARDPERLRRQFVASGDRYVAGRKFPEAVIQYTNAVTADPRFGEGHYKLGLALETTGDLKGALREYVRAAALLPGDADAQLHAAKFLAASGQYAEARDRASAVLAKDPRNVTALIVLGSALSGMKDVDGAIQQVETAIDAEPRRTFSYANLGLLELSKGDAAAAEAAFSKATEVAPDSIPARLNLGNFYWASGSRAKAEREFKRALAIDAASAEANRVMAAFYLTGGQPKTAEPYFIAFAAAATTAGPRLALADFYLADGRAADAARVLEPLRLDADGVDQATIRLAGLDFLAGRHDQAYQALEGILKTHPFDDAVLDAKARFLYAERRYDEAVATADIAVKANPQDARSQYLRGMALEAEGATEDAIKAFRTVLSLSPSAVPADMHLANLALVLGDTKTAIASLTHVVNAEPASGNAHLLLGRALLQSGDLAGAAAQFQRLAAANPSAAEIQVWLGHLAMARPDLKEARRAYSRALDLDPRSLDALKGLTMVDLDEKKPDAARARLGARLAANPNDAALFCLAGKSFVRIGDAGRAEASFRRALALDPANLDAYLGLGGLFVFERRLDEALAEYAAAARREAKPVVATTLIGIILQLQNKRDEARQQYERALTIDPRAAVAANNLAWIHADRGDDLDEALRLARTAKAELPDNAQVSDTIGWVYYKKNLGSLAIAALRQAAQQDPSDPGIHYHLGLAYLKDGEVRQAQEQLERALALNPRFDSADDARRVLKTITGL